ncbi:MAG TPA: matrixin family metalloprotease [Actinomycetales bacterium]|nr:matrixin family metalloprotease [Actinomycetales bacterium]
MTSGPLLTSAQLRTVLGLVLAGVVGLLVWRLPTALGDSGLLYPPLPADARSSRLLPPVEVVSSGPHVFRDTLPGGSPVTYDPCRPVHYVVSTSSLPTGGPGLVHEAMDMLSGATGLVFVDDGLTDERLSEHRKAVDVPRYGNRWSPVLIGWSDAAGYPALAGDVAGVGGSTMVTPRGPASARLVSGQVALDADVFDALARSGAVEQQRAIVLHELAHVVGLGHVNATTELMYPSTSTQARFGPGDLEGLAVLGQGVCHTDM